MALSVMMPLFVPAPARAGEELQASAPLLPAAGLVACCVTQSTPAITPLVLPLPPQPSTFTPCSGAPGTTPTTPCASSFAATVPDTCVPCPLQSLLGPPAKFTCSTTFRSG